VPDAEEHAEAASDVAHDRAVDHDPRFRDALHDGSHGLRLSMIAEQTQKYCSFRPSSRAAATRLGTLPAMPSDV